MEVDTLYVKPAWDERRGIKPWHVRHAEMDISARYYHSHALQFPIQFVQSQGSSGYLTGVDYGYRLDNHPRVDSALGHTRLEKTVDNHILGLPSQDYLRAGGTAGMYGFSQAKGAAGQSDVEGLYTALVENSTSPVTDDGAQPPRAATAMATAASVPLFSDVRGVCKVHMRRPRPLIVPTGRRAIDVADGQEEGADEGEGKGEAVDDGDADVDEGETWWQRFVRVFPQAVFTHNLSTRVYNSTVHSSVQYNAATGRCQSRVQLARTMERGAGAAPVRTSVIVKDTYGTGRTGTVHVGVGGMHGEVQAGERRGRVALTKEVVFSPVPRRLREHVMASWRAIPEMPLQLPRNVPPPLAPPHKTPPHAQGRQEERMLLLRVVWRVWRAVRAWWLLEVASFRYVVALLRQSNLGDIMRKRLLEQAYILCEGVFSLVSAEVRWTQPRFSAKALVPRRRAFRVPIELHWGCDLFRFFFCIDLWHEVLGRKWVRDYTFTAGMTLFNSFTVFERVVSLSALWRRMTAGMGDGGGVDVGVGGTADVSRASDHDGKGTAGDVAGDTRAAACSAEK